VKAATTLERAFELARRGDLHSIAEIRRVLNAEGYIVSQLQGPQLIKQLRALIRAVREE